MKMLHSFQVSKSVPTAMQQEQRCIGIKAEEGRREKKKKVRCINPPSHNRKEIYCIFGVDFSYLYLRVMGDQ